MWYTAIFEQNIFWLSHEAVAAYGLHFTHILLVKTKKMKKKKRNGNDWNFSFSSLANDGMEISIPFWAHVYKMKDENGVCTMKS